MSETQVKCPTCTTNVVWNAQSEYRPFCSKRCQLIDLAEWANESHTIEGKPGFADVNLVMDEQDIDEMLAQQEDSFFK